ncbi:site-specific integrase [Nocardioides agariphilus]|uniref:Site-specific integrase n=1 Tax=Nocardioides agariphilus TaxID=433664 RepID=A0A930YH71_9ACTN|nr:tyrosine-type recombinase/integrase [Nocardioides agariphilus]MBF4768341.1 site-specific integrase [Nocardioides agariphilus]
MARRKTGPRAWVRVSQRTKAKNIPANKRRWEVLYEDPNADPPFKKRTKGGFQTKAAAERWRDEESPAAKHNAGQPWVDPSRGDVTFQAVAEEWLATYTSKSGKARGYSQHAAIITGPKSLVRTAFGHRRIGDITHGDVAAWLAAQTASRAPSTVRHNFYTLRRVIRYAVANGLIMRDPTIALSLPEQRDVHTQQADRVIPSTAQVLALIAATPEPWSMYVRLAAATGMRPEELAALQLRDLSDDNATITVRRVRVKGRDGRTWIYEDLPKTKRSRRSIDLDDFTAQHLRAYLETMHELATRWFTAHPDRVHPGDRLPLFPHAGDFRRGGRQRKTGTDLEWLEWVDADGEPSPLRHGWFTMRYWSDLLDAAKVPSTVRFYDLRHFHASWLVAQIGRQGALTIVEISQRLGHASTKMTLDRYAHATPGRDKRNATAAMWETPDTNVVALDRTARPA